MKISFWLRSRKTQKIVHFRITIQGEQLNVSTGIAAKEEHWLGSDNLFNPIKPEYLEYNNKLCQIRTALLRAYNDITSESKLPTSAMVLERYYNNMVHFNPVHHVRNVPTIEYMLQKVIDFKNSDDGISIGKPTLQRYTRFQKRFIEYLTSIKIPIYSDITKVDEMVMRNFINWLSTVKGYGNDYVNKHRDFLICFVQRATKEYNQHWRLDWIQEEIPLLPKDKLQRIMLEPYEIEIIRNKRCLGILEKVQDMFLFMCETGLHIVDYKGLRKKTKINIDEDNQSWVAMQRQKTKVEFNMPLTDEALRIINKYGGLDKLPSMDDQKYNDLLKVLGLRCDLSIDLTSKVARKSFCHRHLNFYKTNMDITAKIMGLVDASQIKAYGEINWETTKAELRKTM